MFPAWKKENKLGVLLWRFMMDLHQFFDLTVFSIHDCFKTSGLEDNATSNQDDIAAVSQERDVVRDKDSSSGRK